MYEYDPETQLLKQSYWSKNGRHQDYYDELERLVPDSGEADDEWVEMLRCIGNIYYDCYQNGGSSLAARSDELDTILNCGELPDKIDSDLWAKFYVTVVAHRDQLVDPDGEKVWHECEDCEGDGKGECSTCEGVGGYDEWKILYLHDTAGSENWMIPLEAVTDAVVELCFENLN